MKYMLLVSSGLALVVAISSDNIVAQDHVISDSLATLAARPLGAQYVVHNFGPEGDVVAREVDETELCDAAEVAEEPALQCDCILCRPNLTGDWHGKRTTLAEHGIVWQGQLMQFHQGVTQGGARRDFDYGGKLDQFVLFDLAKLGLCHHLTAAMHVETRFGETVVPDAVLLAPVNGNLLYPKLNENDTAITGLMFELALTDEWALTFGRINALDLWTTVYPQTGRGVDGFMNASLLLPLTLARTFPLVTTGAGVIKREGGQVQGALLVYDSKNTPTTSGLDDLFDNGANVLGLWRIFTESCGRPGSHAVIGTWASGDFTELDPLGWAIIPGQGIVAPESSGSWSVQYIYEQKLWVDPCNEKRNMGLLSWCGYADPENSPFEWVANVSLQTQGLFCGRENDTMGAGYFYTGISDDFKNLLAGTVPVDDLQGVEIYYTRGNHTLVPSNGRSSNCGAGRSGR